MAIATAGNANVGKKREREKEQNAPSKGRVGRYRLLAQPCSLPTSLIKFDLLYCFSFLSLTLSLSLPYYFALVAHLIWRGSIFTPREKVIDIVGNCNENLLNIKNQ